jgi:riboflavin kinase/FMN adenylyltransferase
MRIIADARAQVAEFPRLVLTIGSFDGVHLGHRRIIERVVAQARAMQGTAGLMTLRPHPRQFFSPGHAPNMLSVPGAQERLLAAAGIDVLFILPFHAETASLDREDFLREVVLGRCGAEHLVVGHDFSFGKGAKGDFAYLASVAPGMGFGVEQVSPLIIDGERVSSTLIREYVIQGDLEKVEQLLGRKYSVEGRVVQGRGMGRRLGFPTANLETQGIAVPAHGVYAAKARVEGAEHVAAVNIGIAPTLAHDRVMIEAFLLDFEGDLLNKTVELVFYQRLRPEKKYPNLDALTEAIAEDVAAVRGIFSRIRG